MARKDGVYQQHGPRDLWDADYGQDVAALPSMAAMDPDQTGPAAATAASSALVSPSPQADGTSLSPTADGVAMLQFITGLDGSGKLDVTDPNYWNWDGNNPATFKDNFGGLAHVWDNSKAVTYWFNPASNWSAAEQASFTSALNFWSAVSNIQFTLSNAVSQPSNAYVITRGSDGQAFTNANYSFDFTLLKGKTISATTSIDTNVNGWTALGSFSVTGGYGPQTVLHETATALGLGRPGPYTATLAASQVIFTADTRQYTVMSYVDPGSAIANSVATKNGDTPSPANYNGHYLTTPGQYDILAMQRLYGAPAASTPLTVGETFGFNASAILKSSLPAFDFTVNTNPVVTIYDSGTGNTLDLSGFSTPSTVDLNPGQFSSADGMVDNIGIAFNTSIDTAIGGSGDDTFYVNAEADTIDGKGGNNTVVFPANLANYTRGVNAGAVTVTKGGITDTLSNIKTLQFADQSIPAGGIACFVRGTRILTPDGEVPVEALHAGDVVCTGAGRARPVKWIGYRTISLAGHPRPETVAPIRIRRDAFGDGVPGRDLLLSPDHAVLVNGVLIPAKLLANGCTILQDRRAASLTYLHLELDRHDIVFAEGLAVESYLDTGNRAMFANGGLPLILHPDFTIRSVPKNWDDDGCAPLILVGPELQAARITLLERAAARGYRMVDDPCLRLAAGGCEVVPMAADAGRYVFALPAGARYFRIHSRHSVPAEVQANSNDRRTVGVAVRRMSLVTGQHRRDMPLDHPDLRRGWHGVESNGTQIWRWTDGAALVPLPGPLDAGTLIEIECRGHLPYGTSAMSRHGVAA